MVTEAATVDIYCLKDSKAELLRHKLQGTWRKPAQETRSRMRGVWNTTEAVSGAGSMPGSSVRQAGISGR